MAPAATAYSSVHETPGPSTVKRALYAFAIWRVAREAAVSARTVYAYQQGRWVGGWAHQRIEQAVHRLADRYLKENP